MLVWAARSGHYDVCRLLIERGADVNARTATHLTTPLEEAAENGHYEVCRLLIERGAETKDHALWRAAAKGRYDVCRLLIERGADVNARWGYLTPLEEATWNGHYDVCRLLMKHGADVNRQSEWGKNLLRVLEAKKPSRAPRRSDRDEDMGIGL